MILLTGYKSKKELKENIGNPLQYLETSIFGNEYISNGTLTCAHRPQLTGLKGREFFAEITMKNDKIKGVK